MTLAAMITAIVGSPPIGWEFVPYILAAFTYFAGIWIFWKVVSIPLTFLRR